MDNQLSEDQKRYLDDTLKRGDAFEQMLNSKGWEYVKSYYQGRVVELTNILVTRPDISTEKLEPARFELIGLQKLLAYIEGDIKTLNEYRDKQRSAE
jgi:hypothetical protein